MSRTEGQHRRSRVRASSTSPLIPIRVSKASQEQSKQANPSEHDEGDDHQDGDDSAQGNAGHHQQACGTSPWPPFGIEVTLTGTYHLVNQIVPFMKQQRWGRIVNVSSVAGDLPFSKPQSVTRRCFATSKPASSTGRQPWHCASSSMKQHIQILLAA